MGLLCAKISWYAENFGTEESDAVKSKSVQVVRLDDAGVEGNSSILQVGLRRA